MSDPHKEITHVLTVSEQREEIYQNALDFLLCIKWYKRFYYFPLNLAVIFFWLAVGFYSVWSTSESVYFKLTFTIGMGLFGYGVTLLLRAATWSRVRHIGKPLIANLDDTVILTISEGTLSLKQGGTEKSLRKDDILLLKPYRSAMLIKTNDLEFFLPRRLFTQEALKLLGAYIS